MIHSQYSQHHPARLYQSLTQTCRGSDTGLKLILMTYITRKPIFSVTMFIMLMYYV